MSLSPEAVVMLLFITGVGLLAAGVILRIVKL